MKLPTSPTLLATLLLGLCGCALAQTGNPPPAMPHAAPMAHHGKMDPARIEALHAKHLGELKTRLKITAAQEGAWSSFAAAMKPPAAPADRPDPAELDKLPLPARIDAMHAFHAKHQAERQAQREQHENAVKTLYAALTPEQQKVLDAEHRRMQKGLRHGREQRAGEGRKQPPAVPAAAASAAR